MSFTTLNLHPKILKALDIAGYTEPTLIQQKVIPKILRGFDIRASAQTGTGKTAAFLLPVLQNIITSTTKPGHGPRLLVLVPTRELAAQVADQAKKYSQGFPKIKTVVVTGGMPFPPQLRQVRDPHEILIATPGRLIDLMETKKISLGRVETVVLDEADRMLDMGFREPVELILSATPKARQTLLFSATLPKSVLKLSEKFLDKPMEIAAQSQQAKHENIDQKILEVKDIKGKKAQLLKILKDESVESAIIFAATKKGVDILTEELYDLGFNVDPLHGDMDQKERARTIRRFRDKRTDFLVATDIAARGIDIDSLSHVINFDLPRQSEDYVHRIGRVGRAGAVGTAISLVSKQELPLLRKIEQFMSGKSKETTSGPIKGPRKGSEKKPTRKAWKKKRPIKQKKAKRPYASRK
ncbi:MAG: ATP-dependent RNA helicase RhlE [Chlamydiia bacterium]|nr:ATP-dependent RNA helicase RhlE [Chlamydiia bacterium]